MNVKARLRSSRHDIWVERGRVGRREALAPQRPDRVVGLEWMCNISVRKCKVWTGHGCNRHQRSAAHLWASFLAERNRIANLAIPSPAHIENDSLWKLLVALEHRRDVVG